MCNMEISIEKFIQGIFALNTRRFGTVAEIMIKKLYRLLWSGTHQYDLYDENKEKCIEVKFSRVTKEHEEKINEKNVLSQCISAAYLKNRSMYSDEANKFSFDCNIQQIKCRNFDYLFYGLFFMDCIEIYGIPSTDVYNIPGYSDHQHEGNVGEGQFHLNNSSIDFHRENCYQMRLTYDELYELLQD